MIYEEQELLKFPNCWYEAVSNDMEMIEINLKKCLIKSLAREQLKYLEKNDHNH